jgi:DNA-binding response OmpR family regulator
MRLLLVEDNARLSAFVAKGLGDAGFIVDAVALAEDARSALATTRYDAVLLDLGLPDEDGMGLLRDLRRDRNPLPVLILSARDDLSDRVAGLDAGADDYVLKPFELAELVARVKALLRRPGGALGLMLEADNMRFDTVTRAVEVDGRTVLLARRELALLELLMRRLGRVVGKDALEEGLYGFGEEIGSNSLEVHVSRLRKKLAAANARPTIQTVRGVGYFLAEAAS